MKGPTALNRKVLVTGGSGFIGQNLVQVLLMQGFEVHLLLRSEPKNVDFDLHEVNCHFGDLANQNCLEVAVAGAELVFHLAGLTRAKSFEQFLEANARGVANLAKACLTHAPSLSRFVLVSSMAAAGPGTAACPRLESDKPSPVSAYGRSKLAGEHALQQAFAASGGPAWTIVRPPIVYGPWDKDVLTLLRGVQRGWALIPAGPERSFSLVYGPDLAAALVSLAQNPAAAGEVIHAAHSRPYGHRAMLDAMGVAVGRAPRCVKLPRWLTWGAAAGGSIAQYLLRRPPLLTLDKHHEVMAPGWVASTAKLQELNPALCATGLEEGLAATVEWSRARGWLH